MIPDGVKIVYVSREIERALGFPLGASYHIVSNATAYGDSIKIQHPEAVTLIKTSPATLLGTTDLLNRPETSALITPGARLLVFKNTVRVESAAIANRWKLLNPPAALSERIENKLSQIRWLGPLAQKYLPPHAMKVAKYITMKNPEPFILQWAHGHTGDGTMLIRDADELRAIQAKFPERMARVTAYVDGPSFTVNAAVAGDRILIGNVSYQITGLEPFTDNRLSTVGNDWGLACQLLSDNDRQAIETMVSDIGRKLMMDGWKGLFGVDLIKDQARGRLYLIEINARQPASVPFESSLQESARENSGTRDLTIFEAHLAALLDTPIPPDQNLIRISDGAQIIQRVTAHVQSMFDEAAARLTSSGYGVVSYQNAAPNADLLRVQSRRSIMSDHRQFNESGREIAEVIKSSHLNIAV